MTPEHLDAVRRWVRAEADKAHEATYDRDGRRRNDAQRAMQRSRAVAFFEMMEKLDAEAV